MNKPTYEELVVENEILQRRIDKVARESVTLLEVNAELIDGLQDIAEWECSSCSRTAKRFLAKHGGEK